jgi:hypothetical protein
MGGSYSTHKGCKKQVHSFIIKSERNESEILGRICDDNIKMNLNEMRCRRLEWIYWDEERPVASSCEYGNEFSSYLEGDTRKLLDKLCNCQLVRGTQQQGAGFAWLTLGTRYGNLMVL